MKLYQCQLITSLGFHTLFKYDGRVKNTGSQPRTRHSTRIRPAGQTGALPRLPSESKESEEAHNVASTFLLVRPKVCDSDFLEG